MNDKQSDFYQKIRKDVKRWVNDNLDVENKWVDYILAAPDLFHLLCKLTADSDIPSNKKLKLLARILNLSHCFITGSIFGSDWLS